jgi:acetyl esterase
MNSVVSEVSDVDMRVLSVKGSNGALVARLYRSGLRDDGLADTLMVYFHPGGFISGSLEASDSCLREFASQINASLLAPTYTQAADQPFPAAAEDAYAALVACAAHPKRYRWTGKTLIVSGTEAGGNLAAVAALMARDRGGPRLAGQLLISPMLDPGLTSGSMRCADANASAEQIAMTCADGYRDYLPRAADRMHPYACPLASTRLKGLPPTLMVSIEGDPLRDEANAYAAKLAAANVRVETLVLRAPTDADSMGDANARCRGSFDDDSFVAINRFVASLAEAASKPHAGATQSPDTNP